MILKSAQKYFETYAAKETDVDFSKYPQWDRVVVIPAWRESESLKQTVFSIQKSAEFLNLSTLIILVLNGHPEDYEARLLIARDLNPKDEDLSKLDSQTALKIIQVDRPSVGNARKVGMDFAAKLFFEGHLTSPWLRTTDADVDVDLNYLIDPLNDKSVAAELFNFIHTYEKLDAKAAEAHCLYDIFLRYYVAGLEFAGSPYAFHSLGSIISVHAHSYVNVRGFPDRDAAEDFYLLNKLAKVGDIKTREDAPIKIEGRLSDRVPFGTGRGVSKILETLTAQEDYNCYDPKIFSELKTWLDLLREFSVHNNLEIFKSVSSPALQAYIKDFNIIAEVQKLPLETPKPSLRYRHLMNWFDGFRTLKFAHYIRDRFYPSVSWSSALRNAAFIDIMGPIEPKTVFEVGRQLESHGVLAKNERRYIG
jgi:hypothetical protein